MKGFFHVPCRNENVLVIGCSVIRSHKPIAVAVADQDAGNQSLFGGERVLTPLDAVNDVLGIQFIQIALKIAPLVAIKIETSHYFAESEYPSLMPANKFQHFLFLLHCEHSQSSSAQSYHPP
jgi:hypothetical protein